MIKVILWALSQVGYLEKKSNKDLDDFVKNAGDKNYTKYARDLAKTDIFNGSKQGYAWCTTFAVDCFVESYGLDRAKKMLYLPDKSLAASCRYAVNYYKKAGQFYIAFPEVGDQIFFSSNGETPTHTGLIYDVDDKYIYTVEGNTTGANPSIKNGGGVAKKRYKVNDKYIFGFGRPNYDIVPDDKPVYVPQIGDKVIYQSNVHYTNANALTAKTCKPGLAEIKAIYRPGSSRHPYDLWAVKGGGSTVHGWVDEGTFTKA